MEQSPVYSELKIHTVGGNPPKRAMTKQNYVQEIKIRISESQNHRMVWVGRDLTYHLVPTPCHGQGHLPLDQVAQSPIQPGLDHCQGGGSHSFSVKTNKEKTPNPKANDG